MAVKYLSHLETLNINMQGYELQNAVIHTLTNNTRPVNPNVGQVIYNTDNQTLELWDGVNWSSVSGDITSITITTGVGLQGGVVGVTGAVTGSISLNHLGLEDLVDPNKDSIFYWNDLTKKSEFLDIGDGLLINSGVLSNTIINNDQLINGSGYITADSSDTLTNKSGNISQWTNDVGYITDGNTNWNNTYGFITGINWDEITGNQLDINLSGFTNDIGFSTFDGDYNSLTNIPTYTQGSIIFADSDGSLTEDNSQLYWDNVNNRLGIGTTTPQAHLSIGDGLTGNVNVHLNKRDNNSAGYYIINEGNTPGRTVFVRQTIREDAEIGTNNSNDLSLLTNDTVRLYIDGENGVTQGYVGIGTTSPTERLDVNGNIKADGILKLYDITDTQKISLNPDSDSYISGNLGIGTATPSHKLTVNGDISIDSDKFIRFGSALGMQKKSNGEFIFFGGSNLTEGGFHFKTWSNSAYVDGSLVLRNNGNVGIGTTSPTEKLDVIGNIKADGILKLFDVTDTQKIELNPNGTSYIAQRLSVGTTSSSQAVLHIQWSSSREIRLQDGSFSNVYSSIWFNEGNLYFAADGQDTREDSNITFAIDTVERLRINNEGSVGIGTTTPNDKLDIDGDIRVKRTNRKPTHEDVLTSDFVSVGSVSFYTDDWVKVKVIGRGDSGVNKSFAEYLIYYDGANYNIELLNNIVIGDNSGFPLLRMNGSNLEIKNRDSVNAGNYLIYFDDFISQTLFSGKTYRVEDFPLIWINDLYYNTYKDNTFVPNQNISIPNQSEYDTVTTIDLNNQSLTTDFTNEFLNKFTNLTTLRIGDNPSVSVAQVESLTKLTYLGLNNNNLTSINLTNNTELIDLYLFDNALSSLDITNCVALEFINCSLNAVGNIDFSNNVNLLSISAAVCGFTSIDVSSCIFLNTLQIQSNSLTALDITNNPLLINLRTQSNQLNAEINSQLLINLDTNGLSNGYFQSSIFGGGSLTAAGQTAKTNLLSKGWTIVGI